MRDERISETSEKNLIDLIPAIGNCEKIHSFPTFLLASRENFRPSFPWNFLLKELQGDAFPRPGNKKYYKNRKMATISGPTSSALTQGDKSAELC
jgi:hypothetical protein